MAAITGAAIAAGGALAGGLLQNNAANKAASAQKNAANQAIAETEQNYQRTASNLNPYISAGNNALTQMQALNSGDYSSFNESPDYQFALNQGLQGLDRSAAAKGSLYSGGQSADVLNYAEGLASQNYDNYYSKLAGLAGSGQSAASSLGSVGTGNAAQVGNYLMNAGNASANGSINSANANSNLLGQLGYIGGNLAGYNGYNPTATSYGSSSLLGGWNTDNYS